MKWLCCILALLVLTLSVQPVCVSAVQAEDTCCSDANLSDTPVDECDNHNSKRCERSCNPFQQCGCCAFCVIVPTQQQALLPGSLSFNLEHQSMLSVGISEAPADGYWQPPRMLPI